MVKSSFKTRLKQLPLGMKMIGFGSALMMLSVFLPWYKDVDRFNTGDTFLGISGPLYFAGLIVLAAAVLSFAVVAFKFMEKEVPKLPLKESHLHIATAALSIFMLVLVNSVYYHVKFGVNLTDKSMGIGMMLTFFGLAFLLMGAVLNSRKRSDVLKNHMHHLEDLGTNVHEARRAPAKPMVEVQREEKVVVAEEVVKEPLASGVERTAEHYSGGGEMLQKDGNGQQNFFGGPKKDEEQFTRKIKIEDSRPVTIEDKIKQFNRSEDVRN